MKEYADTDELRGARFSGVDLSGARFRNVNMEGVKMVDALLANADLSGMIVGLKVNGIEVAPLIAAEMERRHPERQQLFAGDPDGMRRAWSIIEGTWTQTLERARAFPVEALHRRVDEEWSFVETLRHLIFVTDAWISRVVLGEARPYHRLGLPPSFVTNVDPLGIDPEADPTLDEVLEARANRMARVRTLVDDLTPEDLTRTCSTNEAHGYPPETNHQVIACLWTIIDEEWAHNLIANRDLDRLASPD